MLELFEEGYSGFLRWTRQEGQVYEGSVWVQFYELETYVREVSGLHSVGSVSMSLEFKDV